jgi:uroporphyrinogen decarboxylase
MLQVFESWGGELSEREFNEFSLPYLTQIAEKVKAELKVIDMDVPMFVFARGSHYALEVLNASPYDVISLDWTISPQSARQRAPSKTLQGNADPCLLYSSKEKIRDTVKEMVAGFGKTKYIANLGHGMYPDHDPEQLKIYLEAIVIIINDREILLQNKFLFGFILI